MSSDERAILDEQEEWCLTCCHCRGREPRGLKQLCNECRIKYDNGDLAVIATIKERTLADNRRLWKLLRPGVFYKKEGEKK